MQRRAPRLAACAALILVSAAAACLQPVKPATPATPAATTAPPVKQEQATAPSAATDNLTPPPKDVEVTQGPPVQIVLVHYRGTLEHLGCCNNLLYEKDEYVAIKNMTGTAQDIRGWKLANLTRGYPSFTFPDIYPCIPNYKPEEPEGAAAFNSYYKFNENPADSVESRFKMSRTVTEPIKEKIDWTLCKEMERLDETPMEPVATEASKPIPCILYPGQTVLVFTDEIHCQFGGFTFNYGLGNIWNNQSPDTAVLYDANGREVSRRSYFTGR